MLFSILEFDVPQDGNYMVLESLKSAPAKVVHVVNLDKLISGVKSEVSVGRMPNSDIKIADISVSRMHASFIYDKDLKRIKLVDNGSKFGTMARIPKPISIMQSMGQEPGCFGFSKVSTEPTRP